MMGLLRLLISSLTATGVAATGAPEAPFGIFLPITNPRFYYGEISSVRQVAGQTLRTEILIFDVYGADLATSDSRAAHYALTADCDRATFEISAASRLGETTGKSSPKQPPAPGSRERRHVQHVVQYLCADLTLTGGNVVGTKHTFATLQEFLKRSVDAAALEISGRA